MSIDTDPQVALEGFFKNQTIDEIVRVIKTGKEAVVYLVRKSGDPSALYAAKIYKDLSHRSFSRDMIYLDGRVILDERERRAVSNRTRLGRQFAFGLWVRQEQQCLLELHRAGADVPRVVGAAGAAILMDYIGNEDGPAPMLRNVRLRGSAAQAALEQIVENVGIFLDVGYVHGDLSPYNILYWHDAVTIIDLPQAIDLWKNPHSRDFLIRDLENVCGYFRKTGLDCSAHDILERYRHQLPWRW